MSPAYANKNKILKSSNTCRRPAIDHEDKYFCGRYVNETVALEMEANIVKRLSEEVATQERELLLMTATSLGGCQEREDFVSKPGIPPSILFVHLFNSRSLGVVMEPACLPCVGIAVACLPKTIRSTLQEFLVLHKVKLALTGLTLPSSAVLLLAEIFK